jgi:beta-glucosidase
MERKRKLKKTSRRQFLRTALVTTGGLALSSCNRIVATSLPTRPPSLITPSPSPAQPIYPDPTRPIQERVDDLVDRMTVDELVSQMGNESRTIPRLDIPAYNWWSEAGHGVARAGIATVFPQTIGMAATWNTDLIRRTAEVISDEGRAKYHDAIRKEIHVLYFGLTFFSPNMNIFRDPRWGRGQETYGEDPYLTSRLAVEYIRGMQGDDPRYLKTVATAKHFAVHSGPEKDRLSFNAVVSQRDLRMTYLPAFEACVTEAKAASVMGAYNRVNGEACCASPTLLQKILRGEWGFDGYVVSDCGAVSAIFYNHHLVGSEADAAALAVTTGCDLECGCTYGIPCFYFGLLQQGVERNVVSMEDLRQSVKRLFTARFRLGMFDPPSQVPYAQIPISVVDSPDHREMALEVARQSLVLLKNQGGVLPLDKNSIRSIAVIGPKADNTTVLVGNYNGVPAEPVSVVAGIRALLPPEAKVKYTQGCDINDEIPGGVETAVQMAKESQVAVMVLGLSQELESEIDQQGGNPEGDRTAIELPAPQEKLLEAVFATGVSVVVVLLNGSAVAVPWADEHVPAILEAWYPGQAGGTAVAEALFGLTNPGGRLPVTFYHATADLPAFENYSMENRTYRYFKGSPLYSFGYGLSYTSFTYRYLQIDPPEIKAGESVTVRVEIENTGALAGDEVAQLYLKDLESSLPVPRLSLQGFTRIHLAPGEKQTLKFSLAPRQMSLADESGKWVLEPGVFAVWVGGRQPDLTGAAQPVNVLEGQFTVRE